MSGPSGIPTSIVYNFRINIYLLIEYLSVNDKAKNDHRSPLTASPIWWIALWIFSMEFEYASRK